MKKDSKVRLFEVMGRLDKTFKPRLNEGFEEEVPAETDMEMSVEEPKEKTPEEKIAELTAKVDELYAMLHPETEETPAEPEGEETPEGLEEEKKWNFEKGKGAAKKFGEKEKEESPEHEKAETPAEEKKEHETGKELEDMDESKPNAGKKIPVAAIAKVGK